MAKYFCALCKVFVTREQKCREHKYRKAASALITREQASQKCIILLCPNPGTGNLCPKVRIMCSAQKYSIGDVRSPEYWRRVCAERLLAVPSGVIPAPSSESLRSRELLYDLRGQIRLGLID
jgi:hypothetical protein